MRFLSQSARRGPLAAALVVACAIGLSACASNDVTNVEEGTPADELYNRGLASMQEGKFSQAVKNFQEVDRNHPYSDWARKSLVMQAYTNYQIGNYTEAIGSARRFVTLYPTSEDAPYALWIVGESYYRQIPDITRDQDMTKKALAAYGEIVEKYPDSQYAETAKQRMTATRDQLAGKEMEVGRYYLSRRQYLAAINRFKVVAQDYQRTRHVEEALARLAESYMALGVVTEAQTAGAVLGHNFPQSQWYKDTYSLLQSGGVEPREDSGSWISRAFQGFKLI